MHVGTFAGGFSQAITRLDYLSDLGVNAIELMPIWEFAGGSSWGYNAAHPFALESTYGTPDEFKQFVDNIADLCNANDGLGWNFLGLDIERIYGFE